MKKYLFRCDVSPVVGTGHLRRSMVLANELKNRGASIFCLLRTGGSKKFQEVESICDGIETMDWNTSVAKDAQEVVRLSGVWRTDTVIIDHYRADAEYQLILYNEGITWLQYDNCSQKPLWARWVIDPSLSYRKCDYGAMIQRENTQLLLGPRYAFLRKEFNDWRSRIEFRERVDGILLTFGGGDDRGAIIFCLEALKNLKIDIERVVLITSYNPRKNDIARWIKRNNGNIKLIVDEKEIARRIAEAGLGIIGGGMTTFETAALGLPSLIVQIADNQIRNAQAWHEAGVSINLGDHIELNQEVLCEQVERLIVQPEQRKSMYEKGISIVDCRGTERIAGVLLGDGY